MRALVIVVLVCGLLDATAIFNTASFGITCYIATSGIAAFVLLARGWLRPASGEGIASETLKPLVLCIVVLWLLLAIQLWAQIGDPGVVFTQTVLRTILIGHLLVCLVLIPAVGDRRLVERTLISFLVIYIGYGLYDFVAQVADLPRFLEVLRNSHSVAVSRATGAQGWIALPRLSSLSAEPSHTLMQIGLALYFASKMPRFKKTVFTLAAIAFCVGTFARTLWITFLAAACVCGFFWVLQRLKLPNSSAITRFLLIGAALLLPLLAVTVPFILTTSPSADISVLERVDSSRAAVWLFFDHPLTGIGFYGWEGQAARFGDLLSGSNGFTDVHNGVAVYIASLGIAGLTLVYAPPLLLLRADGLSAAEKGWWIATYSLSLVGGDYLGLVSTWTAIGVIVSRGTAAPTEGIELDHTAKG